MSELVQLIVVSLDKQTKTDVSLVKVMRLLGKHELNEAAEIVRYLRQNDRPTLLAAGLAPDVGEYYKGLLMKCGAQVELQPSFSEEPLIVRPRLNRKAKWNMWNGPKTVVEF